MKFKARLISSSSFSRSLRVSIPVKVARKLNLKDDDILVSKLNRTIFPSQIYSNKGYLTLRIPAKLCNLFGLNIGDFIVLRILSVHSYKFENSKIKIFKKNGIKYIDRLKSIPKITNKKRSLVVIPHNENLILWPLSRNADYIITNRYLEMNKLLIDAYNRNITLVEWLFELIGLYLGEGDKGNRFGFTNSQQEIINHFVNFLEKNHNIKRSMWSCNLVYRDKNFDENIEESLKEYWENIANVKILGKTNFLKTKKSASKYGSLHLRLNSDVSRIFYDEWKEYIKLAYENKKLAISMLKGILAAEGWPELSKKKSLNSIEIASKGSDFQKIYRRILKCMGIDSKFNVKSGRIFGWSNFYFLIRHDIFVLHPNRKSILIKGFLNHKKTKDLMKYLTIFSYKKTLQSKQVVKLLGLSKNSIRKSRTILNRLAEIEYLEKKGSGKSNDPYIYRLAKKGNNFLKFLDNLQNL